MPKSSSSRRRMHETDDDCSDDDVVTVPKLKKTSGKATSSDALLQDLEAAAPGIFAKTSNKSKVKCRICRVELVVSGGTKDVLRHLETVKHKKELKGSQDQRSLFNCGVTSEKMSNEEKSFQQLVLNSEVLLSQYIAKANISFNSSTQLME